MMRAWYFATALDTQYNDAIAVIRQHKMDKWTHNKAIQKAIESHCVTEEHKKELRSLRRK